MRTPLGQNDRTPISHAQAYGGPTMLRKARNNRPIDVIMTVLLPWLVFTLIVCLFVFAYEEFSPLVWALLVASALLALLFVAMGGAAGRTWHLALGFLILASIAIAVPIGLYLETNYMLEYWRIDNGAVYKLVSPNDPGASHRDAAVLEFREGTFVDVQRSVGYMKAGTTYCVAPISGRTPEEAAQYWAVGVGCCGPRGTFSCDDAEDPTALKAVTIDGNSNYKSAVRMAESVYGLTPLNSTPVMVLWTKDPLQYKDGLWTSAATLVIVASVVHLLVSLLAGFVLSRHLAR